MRLPKKSDGNSSGREPEKLPPVHLPFSFHLREGVTVIQAARLFSERMKRINIFTSASVSF